MSILKSIKGVFKPLAPTDSFQLVDEVDRKLVGSLRGSLRNIYGGRANDLKDQTLVLWIVDENKRKLMADNHDRLLNNLNNNCGMPVADVVFKKGPIPEGATKFGEGFAFTIASEQSTNNAAQQGTITVHKGKGTLLKEKYIISADGGVFFIGGEPFLPASSTR